MTVAPDLARLGRVVALVQARMGSSRLPGKVMKSVANRPLIAHVLTRVALASRINQVVLATSDRSADDPLADFVQEAGFTVFRGSENDVLARYVAAMEAIWADTVIRITGDCPLADPALIDEAIMVYARAGVDYLSNVAPPTYPDGLDIEVFSANALRRAGREATSKFDREHATPYLRSGRFTTANMAADKDYSACRLTVDEVADLTVVRRIFDHFAPRSDFSWREVIVLQDIHPDIFTANAGLIRNEGAKMGRGQKLWKRAKEIIPGGNMLLSKRSELFLPEHWPAYFSRATGCVVWDLDGNKYLDTGLMGVGTNTLGYGHSEVDAAARAAIDAGNLSTLNAPEEVALAERLIELHGFADMARFARTGGEANAIAIRIARAASGRDGVAICGYHGWHDWYLSANLGENDNLAGHLLPGLDPAGVPKTLCGTVHPFAYNDLKALETLVATKKIGVIKMEVLRNEGPQQGFLEGVRKLADDHGIVLVFDECTSGFRETFGGLYKKFNVEPDLAVFGKTLGNGYAITSVIGRRAVMEAAQTTFISSTFWTERLGSVAALKTLQVMERERSWERLTEIGTRVRDKWIMLADAHAIPIKTFGLPALSGYQIESPDALALKTLITQELLDRGFLAATTFYASLAHNDAVLARYFDALDEIFSVVAKCLAGTESATARLRGSVCHTGFKRLN